MIDAPKPDDFKAIPLTQMRRAIGTRMSEAKRAIPHFRLVADLEVDRLLEWRKELLAAVPASRVSVTELLIKLCAMALMDEPAVNIQWAETEIHQFATADIAIVMAVEGGVSTPVIRHANLKSVAEIAQEARELAQRARSRTLKMSEIVGGSFSISNLGMFGIDQFDAVINVPQCAILALGAAKPRVVVTPERETRVATVMTATLSCDHRAIDGVTGARFLNALRARVESPDQLRQG
ncbi:MAG TPA: dihydrolipoamide acetyltransferase family protein [Steroidobacteraceae bacterium]|jgi:pyruvate dehydrogenase E2 component (dihydrolipoamide acetyltransferase)